MRRCERGDSGGDESNDVGVPLFIVVVDEVVVVVVVDVLVVFVCCDARRINVDGN